MKNVHHSAALLFAVTLTGAAAQAAPQAKEIAFTRHCAHGVPVYNTKSGSVSCGMPKQGGAGYVMEMASPVGQASYCPEGYSFIGLMQKTSLGASGGAQYFACAKD